MNTSWYLDVNRFARQTTWAHSVMRVVATDGVAVFALLVLGAWWASRRRHDAALAVAASAWAAVGTVAAVGVNQLIGKAVREARPYATLHHVEVLVGRSTDYSFPSDHAVTAGAAVAGLYLIAHYAGRVVRRLAVIGTVLALLIAFARVYVGAHYPGDVVAGLAIGAGIVLLGWATLGRLFTVLVEKISQVGPLRPLVIADRPSAPRRVSERRRAET